MNKRLLEIESLGVIVFAAFLGIFFAWQSNQESPQQFPVKAQVVKDIPVRVTVTAAPTLIPTAEPTPQVDTTEQISSDGTKTLKMRTASNANGTKIYTFSTVNDSDKYEQIIYSTPANAAETMSIPFNTWSPDNNYFFILKNDTEGMVFKASGDPFADGEPYIDITEIFNQQNTNYSIREVTGWTSGSTIIFNTAKPDNTIGPSFWFYVPAKQVIYVSTLFD